MNVVDLSVPLVIKFEDPINRIDDLMCKSLDVVEHNIPMVTYTPEEVSVFIYTIRVCYCMHLESTRLCFVILIIKKQFFVNLKVYFYFKVAPILYGFYINWNH